MASVAPPVKTSMPSVLAHEVALKLLVVDDYLVVSASVLRSLPNTHISYAVNGVQVLEKMRTQRYDLVLMDLVMPDLSGTEVVRRIRQETPAPLSNVPVIAITANMTRATVAECQALGFLDVMPKPFDHDALIQAILPHALKEEPRPLAL